MRRYSIRVVLVVVLALCLSVVPVGTASALSWSDSGTGFGFWNHVELLLVQSWSRWVPVTEAVEEPRSQAYLEIGTVADPEG